MDADRFIARWRWLLAAVAVAALATPLFGDPYYTKLVARFAIFAIVAVSLDLVVGYAGLVSLGHAAFFGLGVYTAGVLALAGVREAWLVVPAAAAVAAAAALLTGAIALRARGLNFLFITLAFAQMVFFIAAGIKALGADDGARLAGSTLVFGTLDLSRPAVAAYGALAVLALVLLAGRRLGASHFGRVIVAARDNEAKLGAVGLSAYPYHLALYAAAAGVAGVAGVLWANLTGFVSPSSMAWSLSGEFLFMVILGGAGTLAGPVLGAVLFVVLELVLSSWTEHWPLALGLVLVGRVLVANRRKNSGAVHR